MSDSTRATDTARDYYNSADADRFYATIWGGEDIHVGIYDPMRTPIAEASRRTVERMAELVVLGRDKKVIDLGSGYGGAARHLADAYGCRVVGLNLSDVENRRARRLNKKAGLDDKIEIVDGAFENIPAADDSFDVAWSQDAILHSGDRGKVFAEVARVLRPGGHFVFTDPMQADDCPREVLEPILRRIHLSSLGSPGTYEDLARNNGFTDFHFHDLTEHLSRHYSSVLRETQARSKELLREVSREYVERMKTGLGHWIEGGKAGNLAWGIFSMKAG